jgi:formylglycine-generating enzyme required for sulfatase activity
VRGDDIGAEVTINGKFRGECPFDVAVVPGTIKLRASKKADQTHDRVYEQDFRVAEDSAKKIEVKLTSLQLNANGKALAEQRKQQLKAQGFEVGKTFRDCPDCPEMVVIPGGSFTMGSPDSEQGRGSDEGPQHLVTIAVPIAVGKFTVTFNEWDACVIGGGCNAYNPKDQDWGRGTRPVINVSWNDAQSYVTWLSQKTGRQYRLLSESEWEYAARAGSTTAYYWGDTIGSGNANCRGCNGQSDKKQTEPVGSFAPNAFGLYDMSGNVWQWTQDCVNENYSGAPDDGRAWMSGNCGGHALRGGSWGGNPQNTRSADRYLNDSGFRYDDLGFRLARTLP